MYTWRIEPKRPEIYQYEMPANYPIIIRVVATGKINIILTDIEGKEQYKSGKSSFVTWVNSQDKMDLVTSVILPERVKWFLILENFGENVVNVDCEVIYKIDGEK